MYFSLWERAIPHTPYPIILSLTLVVFSTVPKFFMYRSKMLQIGHAFVPFSIQLKYSPNTFDISQSSGWRISLFYLASLQILNYIVSFISNDWCRWSSKCSKCPVGSKQALVCYSSIAASSPPGSTWICSLSLLKLKVLPLVLSGVLLYFPEELHGPL